jgi:adenylate cyclase
MGKYDDQESLKVEEFWRRYLSSGDFEPERRQRRFFRHLPGHLRCKNCYAPFDGVGSIVVRLLYGKMPSKMNPRLCNLCDVFAAKHQGGAEVELTLLFIDVRGSTSLAEQMTPMAYSRLINRFYSTATQVMVNTDALIDKIIGDQAAGMYVPGFAGSQHAQRALEAAKRILTETGHGAGKTPWIPLGAGIHTGVAFVGSMRSEEGVSDITVLGDVANIAARLSSAAGIGEILISEEARAEIGLDPHGLERRSIMLKGKSAPVEVTVHPA